VNDQDWMDEGEFEDDQPQQGGNLVNELRKQNRAMARQLKEQQDQFAELKEFRRQSSIKGALESAGVHAKVAGLVPKDIETADQVKGWLEEYGDALGVAPMAQQEQAPVAQPPAVDAGQQAQLQAMQDLAQGGLAPSGTVTARDLESAGTFEEFRELLRKGGAMGL